MSVENIPRRCVEVRGDEAMILPKGMSRERRLVTNSNILRANGQYDSSADLY